MLHWVYAVCRLTGEGARRRTFTPGGVDSTTTTGRLSNSSLTPPIGSSSNGMGLPVPDFVGQLGIVQEEGGVGGYGAGSAGGRQVTSLASRLSQQALSEIKDRWAVRHMYAFTEPTGVLYCMLHAAVQGHCRGSCAAWGLAAPLNGP